MYFSITEYNMHVKYMSEKKKKLIKHSHQHSNTVYALTYILHFKHD